MDTKQLIVVSALFTASRHPAIGFSIAATNAPKERFGAAILLYVLLGLVVGAAYIFCHHRREAQILSTSR